MDEQNNPTQPDSTPISWWKTPRLTKEEVRYLKTIQQVFKVKDAAKRWIPYNLMPHQMDFHKDDIALKGSKAKSRVVVKSRNTSFTTSVCISNLMAVPYYPNQIVPFVRLNEKRAYDLIDEIKDLIRNMEPINIQGLAYPFDPRDVNMDSAGKIRFPNKVSFEAYPANAIAAENIRGLRIAGSAGVLDEVNFMDNFSSIYISLRDAASGFTMDGEKHFQISLGTTLKGNTTQFALWYKKQEELIEKYPESSDFNIYKWQVFDPAIFNKDIEPLKQPNLIPIVPWHLMHDLNRKYLEDLNTFLEEYMAAPVDAEDQFYPSELYTKCVNKELKSINTPKNHGEYFAGIDVASVNDFFVLSIFENVPEEREKITYQRQENGDMIKKVDKELTDVFYQRFLYYDRAKDISEMENKAVEVINNWAQFGLKKVRIDSGGIGLQLYQNLKQKFKKQYPNLIEYVPLGTIKVGHESKRAKEVVHVNQKQLMIYDRVKLIDDEMQKMHYSVWTYKYECERTKEYGHGDIAVANAYAVLPLNFQGKRQYGEILMAKEEEKDSEKTVKEEIKDFHKLGWKEKMKFYRRQ
jgi:hypothetical protein